MAEKKYFFLCLLHYNDTCKENQQFTGGEHRVVKRKRSIVGIPTSNSRS